MLGSILNTHDLYTIIYSLAYIRLKPIREWIVRFIWKRIDEDSESQT